MRSLKRIDWDSVLIYVLFLGVVVDLKLPWIPSERISCNSMKSRKSDSIGNERLGYVFPKKHVHKSS